MVGRTVGKYRVVEQIGRGGMGTVYKAVDETLDRIVAIKVLNGDLLEQDAVERFRREAMTLARLSHPRIGAIHELTRDGHDLLMVMEFISGETFEKLIERAAPLPVPQAVTLSAQVLDGLQYAHNAGVVHRDLKPANLILTPAGDVKIMDFGIARVQGSEHLTSHGFMVGTPAYMAPEQVRGEEVDPRMDLYAIAVVLYRLLTHRLPFQGDTAIAMIHSQLNNPPTPPRQFRADLPDWVVATLARGLAKVPAERFQTAAEFRAALEGGLTGRMAIPVTSGNEATPGPMLTPPPMPATPSTGTSSQPVVGTTVPPPVTGAQPIAAAPSAAVPVPQSLPQPPPRPEATVTLRAPHLATAGVLLALLLVGIGVLAFVALRRPTTVVAPGEEQAAGAVATDAQSPTATNDTPAAGGTSPGSATPAAADTGAATGGVRPPAGAASTSTDATARRTAAAPAPAPPLPSSTTVAGGATAAAPAAAPPAAAAPAAADAPAEHFGDVKTIVVDGGKTREVDALLSLEPGNIVVRTRSDSTVLKTLAYQSITGATYARAKRPRGQKGPGMIDVPENFGGSGFFGSARHWFTLQTPSEFLVVRLEDRNVIRVLSAFEARTGLKIQRNQDD